jgi:hypothetical protein
MIIRPEVRRSRRLAAVGEQYEDPYSMERGRIWRTVYFLELKLTHEDLDEGILEVSSRSVDRLYTRVVRCW